MASGLSKVKVTAPATIANLGPGFDVLGVSVDAFHDVVEVELSLEPLIEVFGVGAEKIPKTFQSNTAGCVAEAMLKDFDIKEKLRLKIWKGVKPSSGLGSSAASAAATALAINELFNLKLSMVKLVEYASLGEVASAGVPHADNVAPAIFGGFTIVRYDPLRVVKLNPPDGLVFCIAIPNIELPTRMARSILPKKIPLNGLVRNVGNACLLVLGLIKGDITMIGSAMSDAVVEPVRAKLITGYDTVKTNAMRSGAVGVILCGAGPSMAAIVDERKVEPNVVVDSMKRGFEEAGIDAEAYVSKVSNGVEVVEKS
jgi:homoserine kinase